MKTTRIQFSSLQLNLRDAGGSGYDMLFYVRYDWDSIIENNFNDENFLVFQIGFVHRFGIWIEQQALLDSVTIELQKDNYRIPKNWFADCLPNGQGQELRNKWEV
jgi:hypothetical protein